MISLNDYPYAYYHLGDGGCKEVAFLFNHEPVMCERVNAEDVIMLDGREPSPGEKAYCGSCGGEIIDFLLEHVKKRLK